MKITKLLLTVLSVSFITMSFADSSSGQGNGGDVIVCPNWESPKMLDYVEDEVDFSYELDKNGDSPRKRVEYGIQKIRNFIPLLADHYAKYAEELLIDMERFRRDITGNPELASKRNNFYANTQFTTDDLIDIPDSDHDSIPVGCNLKQLIIHRVPEFQIKKRYKINAQLFLAMDNKNIAAAILHEVLYRDIIEKKISNNSRKARALNLMLSTDLWDSLGIEDVVRILTKTGYKTVAFGTNSKNKIVINIKTKSESFPTFLVSKHQAPEVGGLINAKLELDSNSYAVVELANPYNVNRPFEKMEFLLGNITIGEITKRVTGGYAYNKKSIAIDNPLLLTFSNEGTLLFNSKSAEAFTGKDWIGGPKYKWMFGADTYQSVGTSKVGSCEYKQIDPTFFRSGRTQLIKDHKVIMDVKHNETDQILKAIINGICE